MSRKVEVADMFKKSKRIKIMSMGLKLRLFLIKPTSMYNFKPKKKALSPLAGMGETKSTCMGI